MNLLFLALACLLGLTALVHLADFRKGSLPVFHHSAFFATYYIIVIIIITIISRKVCVVLSTY